MKIQHLVFEPRLCAFVFVQTESSLSGKRCRRKINCRQIFVLSQIFDSMNITSLFLRSVNHHCSGNILHALSPFADDRRPLPSVVCQFKLKQGARLLFLFHKVAFKFHRKLLLVLPSVIYTFCGAYFLLQTFLVNFNALKCYQSCWNCFRKENP